MSTEALEAAMEVASKVPTKAGKGLTDFERMFGDVVADVEVTQEQEQRLAACADDEEWRQIKDHAKVAAEQVCSKC